MYEYDDGRLRPLEGTGERLAYNYWLHYAEGTFAPLMILSLVLSRIDEAPMPFLLRPVAKGITQKVRDAYLDANVTRNLEFMDATLRASRWFCGDVFSAADVQMSFALEAAEVRSNLTDEYPHLAAFLETIRARPAYKRALDKGGHYELMGAGRKG
jgi:glutathione S-transferase